MQAVNGVFPSTAPGVVKNPYGGYHIHIKLNERHASPIVGDGANLNELAPLGTPTLAEMLVFEDCIVFSLQGGQSLIVHVSDPGAVGSVVYFNHANGRLWRAVPLEELNPGWVLSTYRFRGDLGKFEARLARMRSQGGIWSEKAAVTFWQTGGWQGAVVYTASGLVYRMQTWQHSELPEPEVATPSVEQVETLSDPLPADVQQIIALQAEGVSKQSYQVGGLGLLLKYLAWVGLIEIINQFCPRQPDENGVSDGQAIAVLIINRMLAPCALRNVAAWVEQSGLHWLLGIADPKKFNYDRLVDALLAVHLPWPDIAAEVTLRAVDAFGLKVETVHYDLTSILFYGDYEGSAWVDYGYSRDHRPDRPQINLGLSATDDGEVVLPGGSNLHPGNTNDGVTTVGVHHQLRQLFQRSDLLVTGDRIMQSAENMLTLARAQARFLGPVVWTPRIRRIVAACAEAEFKTLPVSSLKAGQPLKGVYRRLPFKVKEKLSPEARRRMVHWRKKRGMRGKAAQTRTVHFWMRAVIILDPERQARDAASRQKRIQDYQNQLDWVRAHLNKGRYYGDPDWVAGKLADLAAEFKDVRDFVKVTFSQPEDVMKLTDQLRPDKIAQAAQLDGRWMLVTNQPPDPEQAPLDYLDWMVSVYKNHRHIERRMRNLKSDLPIRPLYAHRDQVIIPLCFVCVLALMLYTLIERDCQANPALREVGLTTTDQLLAVLTGYGLTVFETPSGYQIFWFDTPTDTQTLIWTQFGLPNPGISAPMVRPLDQNGNAIGIPLLLLAQKEGSGERMIVFPTRLFLLQAKVVTILTPDLPFFAIVKVLTLCYAENKL